ncbi:MAG: ABC transporter ATP-binding protein [Proteobacteria bacterium]|nr:ABC transporter ATP-binding protein [Pseudomonadota bacterium]
MEIQFENVEKSWGDVTVMQDINFEIKDKEFVAFLGPSGCGKSTTLMLIAGIYKPTTGNVRFDDSIVNDVESKDRNVGVVFQSYALYPHLNIAENIMFPLQFKKPKVAKDDALKRATEAAKMVNVSDLMDRYPSQLSGGQQQRVALARAIVKEPDLLLLDEPLSNLDASLRISVRAELRRLHRRLGITTVLVTHDQIEATTLADRIVCMNVGNIAQIGTPEDLFDRPEDVFVATFIGSPPINMLQAKIDDQILNIKDTKVATLKDTPSGDYLVGVRPEHVIIGKKGSLSGKITDRELLGRETLYMIDTPLGPINSLLADEQMSAYGIDDKISISFVENRCHLFESKSEKRVSSFSWNS